MNLKSLFAQLIGLVAFLGAIEAFAANTNKTVALKAPAGKNCLTTVRYTTKSDRILTRTFWSNVDSKEACDAEAEDYKTNTTPAVTKSKTVEARFVK